MLDYVNALNPEQYEAVTNSDGNALVVAGAGSGKTRAIVYRLAWLVEHGVSPESILLLTFTRKAAREMLTRAEELIGKGLTNLTGGTFHSFAYSCLRTHKPAWLEERQFTLLDSGDINDAIKDCKEKLKVGKRDSSFPKTQTIVGLLSKARNKEMGIGELLAQESFHLLPHAEDIENIGKAYDSWRREHAVMDYDDLLFELERLLINDERAAYDLRRRFAHILVDEYQDTNKVQARLIRLLAQPPKAGLPAPKVMAVGDEAQSIYGFRGANIRNILDFPKLFAPAKIMRLERNYRSTQPVLDVANGILARASESFRKRLYTEKQGGALPILARPLSDISEAELAFMRIQKLLETQKPSDIAVLFRASFHSYALENLLRKAGIAFRKYGGLKFIEAAHVKDILAFARFAINRWDARAFARIAQTHRGVGPKTVAKLHDALKSGDDLKIKRSFSRYPELKRDLDFIANAAGRAPQVFMEATLNHYRPKLEELYPDDWPSRLPGLEEALTLAAPYESLDLFVADMSLETPEDDDRHAENCVTLSTVHSAKGLEWRSVIILDAVEDRFPSRHAQTSQEDFEEERRLFYVACTRAKENLDIYAPATVYSYNNASMMAESPFLRELPESLFDIYSESAGGRIRFARKAPREFSRAKEEKSNGLAASKKRDGDSILRNGRIEKPDFSSGHCRHKIFGRGKIVQLLGDDRAQVDFPGFGLKIILTNYLTPEA